MMKDNLFAEAESLYRDAKLASFAGKFDEAGAKHTAAALIFEFLNEPNLAARAHMRGVWYQIQSHTTAGLRDAIERALNLSLWESLAGVHQAMEFALFEGDEQCFEVCESKFNELLDRAKIQHATASDISTDWGQVYCSLGIQIYEASLQQHAVTGHKSWASSDHARLLYFRGAMADLAARPQLLADAADRFEGHEIRYRSQLCRAEAGLWLACLSPNLYQAGESAEKSLMIARAIATFSRGVSAYALLLATLSELLLRRLINEGYQCTQISHNSVHPPNVVFKRDAWRNQDRVFPQALLRIVSNDQAFVAWLERSGAGFALTISSDQMMKLTAFEMKRIAYLEARVGAFVAPVLTNRTLPQRDTVSVSRPARHTSADFVHVRAESSAAGPRRIVAVFVHGWHGHQIDTWGNFPGLLESDPDFKEFEFFFWGFPTALTGKNPGSGAIAKVLATELQNRFSGYDLVLIGHSFGGIIVKKMVLECSKELLERTKHVILFATPHLGSPLAEFGKYFNSQIKELRVDSDMLIELERAWVRRGPSLIGLN